MTISDFKQATYGDLSVGKGDAKNSGVARLYREFKQKNAEHRQEVHDADVMKTAADQNISLKEARYVVRTRKRMLHKRDERRRRQPHPRRVARVG